LITAVKVVVTNPAKLAQDGGLPLQTTCLPGIPNSGCSDAKRDHKESQHQTKMIISLQIHDAS
jgi:hypothetical protein